jgi:hypothetical protein
MNFPTLLWDPKFYYRVHKSPQLFPILSQIDPIRRTSEDNIKMNFREIGRGGMDWIYLTQDGDQWKAPVNMVMNLRFP